MSDAADAAGDEQELVEALLLRQHQEAAAKHREALNAFTGECLNCDAPLETGRYCDENCRIDHEKRVSASRRR
jgi:hypothetical protein